jgi:hypothetical protein
MKKVMVLVAALLAAVLLAVAFVSQLTRALESDSLFEVVLMFEY